MFLGLGIGILTAIFVSGLFDLPMTLSFIAGGVVFSLLMDLDFLFHLKKAVVPEMLTDIGIYPTFP